MGLARALSSDDCDSEFWLFSRGYDGADESGDFVDSMSLGCGRRAVIAGDIAGKGSEASLLSRALRAYVRAALFEYRQLGEVLRAADRFFTRQTASDPTMFATLFIGVIDDSRGVLAYASAGHETAVVLGAGFRPVHLATTGAVLGLGLNESCRDRELLLADQNLLVVVSDGITDARAPQTASFFGISGVVIAAMQALFRHRDVAYAIYHAAQIHAFGNLFDDASVVAARIRTHQPEIPAAM